MDPMLIIGIIVLLIVVGILLWFFGYYNRVIRYENRIDNAWAQIDVQLKRRADLIPNLMETVKGYMTHERQTLDSVIQARSQAVGAGNVDDRIKAEASLSGALGRLMLVAEQYPDLKANQNFLSLQEELSSTENKIGFSRQYYNDSVMHYNTKLETFPSNVIGGMFQFKPGTFFEVADAAEREAPKVKF